MAAVITRAVSGLAVTAAILVLAGCGGASPSAGSRASTTARTMPQFTLRAPKDLLSAASTQQAGPVWALAGGSSAGLFQLSVPSGHVASSFSVSGAARSLAESSEGVLGLGLATDRTGALELLSASTRNVLRTVGLPAPVREVVAGDDGTTFYALTGRATTASVSVVGLRSGRIKTTVPVPANAVSIVPDVQQATLYVLQSNGQISQVSIADGKIIATFSIGDPGRWMALSPDGSTLYVLKGGNEVDNIAVVDIATESVKRVLPAPSHCQQLLVSASGSQLYEVVGTPSYGNIQVFAS